MIFTIGHSNHPLDRFVSLLRRYAIKEVIDIRSAPVSRFVPHFNRKALENRLPEFSFRYVYLGKELGGRPTDPAFYDESGHVLYNRLALSALFLQGIEEVLARDPSGASVLMCAEENPTRCHRHHLVSRVLVSRGVEISHIRSDGNLMTFSDAESEVCQTGIESGQTDMFKA